MISKFSSVLGDNGINITDMVNKSKGDYAYTMLDIESKISDEIINQLTAVDGVLRVRVVK